ncbi:hypothetical protein TSTA_023270 [Talaromyces stipitatus ATCC 10500]|uniref:DEAD/DEAH-box helicase domain-containing protein n=1 Tax=Talaromyces stipitatus (strain ATCC 10500 / CBS 375.48 / QM 6759 / NRRL 1006) TaxID=441959 RepID=B8MEZ0_TALSN|nr:uncharacterized protein TSTA_023270 [Talaromyces stipitatus ATCC 10500]EED17273.1 hypothetical protein TSTA_023270 [Talaromyces stipitatus ATCC 10500]
MASYQEVAIAISHRFMRNSRAFTRSAADEAKADEEEDEIMGHVADEQATHSPNTASNIYAREWTERVGEVAERRLQFWQSSQEWHQFLGFQSTMRKLREDQTTPFQDSAENRWVEWWKAIRVADPIQALQEMMGKQIGRGGTMIVVIPLVVLREDIQQCCQRLGISCVEWNSRRPVDGASIVLVTPESTVTETFQTFINRKQWTKELDWIVIDECHMILQEGYQFQKEMAQLGKLVQA